MTRSLRDFIVERTQHDHAVSSAAKLAIRLGTGWESRAWWNSGWHWEAFKGEAHVYPNEDRSKPFGSTGFPVSSYSAYINTAMQFVATSETPEGALDLSVRTAREHVQRINAALDALSGGENE